MEKIDKAEVIKLLYELDLSNKEHQYAVNFINSLPTDNGYTTRNDEVVNIIFGMKYQIDNEEHQDILTDLLSKLKL